MRREPQIALWIDDLSMPCERLSRTAHRDGRESLHATFRIELTEERLSRDAALRSVTTPFAAIALVRVPTGRVVDALLAPRESPSPLASFVYRRTLAIVLDGLTASTTASVSVVFAARATTTEPRAAVSPRGRKLRSFGHRFVLEKHRLPCESELVEGLGIPEAELRLLLRATSSPTSAEDVRSGALPRVTLAFNEAAIRQRFKISEEVEHELEEIGQDFEVTRERIRPVSASAVSKLRAARTLGKLQAFIDDALPPTSRRKRR